MRRKTTRMRCIALALSILMVLQMVVIPEIGNWDIVAEAADATDVVTYADDFNSYAPSDNEQLLETDEWDLETVRYTGTEPSFNDGVVKLSTDNSIQFNWYSYIGADKYDTETTYSFEFDMTVIDRGTYDGSRTLYIGLGGWYTLLEVSRWHAVRFVGNGDTDVDYVGSAVESQTVKVKIDLTGTNATVTIYDSANTTVGTGTRTIIGNVSSNSELQSIAFRCEKGAVEIDNFLFTDGTVTYEKDFGVNSIDTMMETNLWDTENGAYANNPRLDAGVIKMSDLDSLKFNWKNVPNIKAYNKDNPYMYTFEFDAKVTNSGDGSQGSSTTHTRVLYVAPGGYYNQVQINDQNGYVYAGDNSIKYEEATFSQTVHIKIEWCGSTIVTTIVDEKGEVIVRGRRSNAAYNQDTGYMDNMVLRCEDGAVEIDNFEFKQSSVEMGDIEQEVNIPTGQQAVYECKVTYEEGSNTRIVAKGTTSAAAEALGDIFEISDYGMSLGGFACKGSFEPGDYGVKIYLNPTQKAVSVEVTLPNGGVIRRGSHQFLYSCTSFKSLIAEWRNIEAAITDATLTYEDISQNDYSFVEKEPQYEGFEANVYNLITSYNGDAKTTRTFAWTALTSYIGEADMAVQYREVGKTDWKSVDAIREVKSESTLNEEAKNIADGRITGTEEYFKADISDLTPGTTYEYKIGKKNSEETTDWSSKAYQFVTEENVVDEFSFVAIGDTQGAVWAGTDAGSTTKGYQYTQAAITEAMQEVTNPAMLFNIGDITEGGYLDQWNRYFKTLGDYGKTIPHFAAIGNHDVYTPGTRFDLHFNHPNNGGTNAFAEDTATKVQEEVERLGITNRRATNLMANADETVYSFNYGKAHFVVLNSGVYDSTGEVDAVILEGQRAWLEADLQANDDALWTIVIVHEPVYHRLGGTESRQKLYDTIEGYGVDLVLQGHSHLVTRTYPMKNGNVVDYTITDEIAKGTGTVYTTIGATAANHDKLSAGIGDEFLLAFTPQMEQATYTVVDVSDTELKYTVKQINGLVVDEFTIAADTNDIKYEYVEDISLYRTSNEKGYPEKVGYIFAGWWKGDKAVKPNSDVGLVAVSEDTCTGGAWAKYVPEAVLSVKAQTSQKVNDSLTDTKLRLVTTVDSLRYQEVGFDIYYNQGTIKYNHPTDTVYRKLEAIDTNDRSFDYVPTYYHAVSDYFVSYTITGIGSELFDNYEFHVIPYWKTLDGTVVTGVPRERLLVSDDRSLDANNSGFSAEGKIYTQELNATTADTVAYHYFKGASNTVKAEGVYAKNDENHQLGIILRNGGHEETILFDPASVTSGTAVDVTWSIRDNVISYTVGNTSATVDLSTLYDSWKDGRAYQVGVAGFNSAETAVASTFTLKSLEFGEQFKNLPDLIADAASGDTILLSDGIIIEDTITLDRPLTMLASENVTIKEAESMGKNMFELSESADVTVKGASDSAVVTIDAQDTSAEAGRVIDIDTGAKLVLENVTIQNSFCSNGSGAVINYGTLNMTNVDFINNRSEGNGGAMQNHTDGELTAYKCQFINNYASGTNGGGALHITAKSSKTTIQNCIFDGNIANAAGGAIYASNDASITSDSYFVKNRVVDKNGDYTSGYGGAIQIGGGEFVLTDVTFESNSCFNGGAINQGGGTVTATNVRFDSNTTTSTGNTGGAYRVNNVSAVATFTDCNFTNNTAQTYGGVYYANVAASVTFEGCTFSNNGCLNGYGGAIALNVASVESACITFKASEKNSKNTFTDNYSKTNDNNKLNAYSSTEKIFSLNNVSYYYSHIYSKVAAAFTGLEHITCNLGPQSTSE